MLFKNSLELPPLTDLIDDNLVIVHPQVLAGVFDHGGPQGEGVPGAILEQCSIIRSYLTWHGQGAPCSAARHAPKTST